MLRGQNDGSVQDEIVLTGSNVPDNQRLPMKIISGSGTEVFIAGTTDSQGAANVLFTAARQQAHNGLNWDNVHNNTQGTLLTSAARTATATSPDQTNYNARGIQVVLYLTAASGTGGLSVKIQAKDPVSGVYYTLNANPTAVITTGIFIYELYPSTGAASGDVTQRTAGSLPRTFRVAVSHVDATSYTYSLGYVLIL